MVVPALRNAVKVEKQRNNTEWVVLKIIKPQRGGDGQQELAWVSIGLKWEDERMKGSDEDRAWALSWNASTSNSDSYGQRWGESRLKLCGKQVARIGDKNCGSG